MKPMLASPVKDIKNLKYPLFVQSKLDGIRIILHPEFGPVTRNLKPIPNRYIREKLQPYCQYYFDGEIICGEDNVEGVFSKTTSAVMTQLGEPEFTFHLFDSFQNIETPYQERYQQLKKIQLPNYIKLIDHYLVKNENELFEKEQYFVENGYEGMMVKSIDGKYKFGRSTEKQGWLLKMKRFEDIEAIIIGFEEKLTNTNESIVDALGHSKRSSHKDNMIEANTLGALIVSNDLFGEFNVGSGFNDDLKKEIWDNKHKYLGKMIKVKYQPTGIKNKPRFPVFIGFRDRNDLS